MDKISTLVYVVICLATSTAVNAAPCLYGQGCYFPCNCANQTSEECEAGCPGGCRSITNFNISWSGPGCQIGNVAYQKSCRHQGNSIWPADLAVDGLPHDRLPPRLSHDYCAYQNGRTSNGGPTNAWWIVDLGAVHKVQSVTIYGRVSCINGERNLDTGCENRLSNFRLRVNNNNRINSGDICGTHDPYVPLGGSATVTCTTELTGRYVSFQRTGGYQPTICSICEVIIIGYKYFNCSDVSCHNGETCSDVIGCSSCSGSYRPDCKQPCDAGSYGINCAETCGRCANMTQCDRVMGTCKECELWWTDNKCETEISSPVVPTEEPRVVSTTNSSVEIEWDPLPSVPSELAKFYKYKVLYNATTGQTGDLVSHGPGPLSYRVGNLTHNTFYEFTVVTYRVMGQNEEPGGSYIMTSAKTNCIVPSAPRNFSVVARNGTDRELGPIIVEYTVGDSGCDRITNITLRYKIVAETRHLNLNLTSTKAEIQPDLPGEYRMRIFITNNEGLMNSKLQKVNVTDTRTFTTMSSINTTTSSAATDKNLEEVKNNVPSSVVIAVPVVLVLVLAGVGVGVGLFLWRRRKSKEYPDLEAKPANGDPTASTKGNNTSKGFDNVASAKADDEESVVSEDDEANAVTMDEPPESLYANSQPSTAVPVKEFEAYVRRRKHDPKDLEGEYKTLPKEDLERCKVAQTTDNLQKNRYKNIYAYDENRVILECTKPDDDIDYINANYITGFNREKEYIATQGPRNTTVREFWRMIWQEQVNTIVMVANITEGGKGRCAEYWPDNPGECVEIEEFVITLEAVEASADYTTSVLSLSNGDKRRPVRHFHFQTWEDKGNPVYGIMTLLAFFNKVHSFDNMKKAPAVVHCSAGVGRTGTFIVLDILVQQAKVNKVVDIFSCVQKARNERMHMVQTLSQYIFVHDALVEFIRCGVTSLPCSNFEAKYKLLCAKSGSLTKLEKQFKMLRSMIKPTEKNADAVGLQPAHEDKNRDKSVIPDDMARPFLPGQEKDSYINAIFVDSFKYHDFYVVTQLPLPHTIGDFWRLVYHQEITTIIMLNEPMEPDRIYWPTKDEPSSVYGGINVTLADSSFIHRNVTIRTFHISKANKKASEPELIVKHLQLLGWSDDCEVPPQPSHLLELRDQVLKWQQQNELIKTTGNTIVQCLRGVSHSGLYCAATYVLDKMKMEQEVDPFLAVRCVNRRRPEFITSLAQYQFLFTMAKDHMSQFNEYANAR